MNESATHTILTEEQRYALVAVCQYLQRRLGIGVAEIHNNRDAFNSYVRTDRNIKKMPAALKKT